MSYTPPTPDNVIMDSTEAGGRSPPSPTTITVAVPEITPDNTKPDFFLLTANPH